MTGRGGPGASEEPGGDVETEAAAEADTTATDGVDLQVDGDHVVSD